MVLVCSESCPLGVPKSGTGEMFSGEEHLLLLFPGPMWKLTTICNPSSGDLIPSSSTGVQQVVHMHACCQDTHTHTNQ